MCECDWWPARLPLPLCRPAGRELAEAASPPAVADEGGRPLPMPITKAAEVSMAIETLFTSDSLYKGAFILGAGRRTVEVPKSRAAPGERVRPAVVAPLVSVLGLRLDEACGGSGGVEDEVEVAC